MTGPPGLAAPPPTRVDPQATLRADLPEKTAVDPQATLRADPPEQTAVDPQATLRTDLPEQTADTPRLPTVARAAYTIAGKFAQGGIGRILKAHDPVLGRTVALKELLVAGHPLDEERFLREVLLTARLQHPGIVPVYAAGRWPSGAPFYAMKLVSGRSFDRVIEDATTLPARLALIPHVLAIAETIAYAHAQGILHRDLKPGNVLVGEFGETVVIDWGLAKQLDTCEPQDLAVTPADPIDPGSATLLDPQRNPPTPDVDRDPPDLSQRPSQLQDPRSRAQITRVGAVVGTPGYMSPEQADGAETDARTDVFALGAILYHTLAGRLPYDADNVASLLYKTVYESPVPLHTREPGLPEELIAIVDKAMARAPDARYQAAKAFADDLRRFQTGQIVGAHRYTAWEHLVRLVKRWRTQLIVAACALLVVVAVVVVSFREIQAKRDQALAAEAQALARLDTVSFEYARQRSEDDPAAAIALLAGLSDAADWRRIRQVAAGVHARGLPRVLHGHTAAVSRAVFSPDSDRLVTTSDDCTMRLWDLSSGTSRAYHGHTDEVLRAAWSPGLDRVATSSRDQTVRVWDLGSGAAQVLRGHVASVRNVAFTADGRTLYTSDDAEFLRRWDLSTGASEVVDHCAANNFPWTERFIGCTTASAVILHDLATGARTVLPSPGAPLSHNGVASPDGRWIAAGTKTSNVQLWDRRAGTTRVLTWPAPILPTNISREMRFSPDARHLAVPLSSEYLGLWDLAADAGPTLLRPHVGYTRRTAFSADGALLASVGGDNSVKVLDRASASERSLVGTPAFLIDAQFSRDGRHLASVGNDPRVFLWSAPSFRARLWRIGEGPAVASDAPEHGLVAIASAAAIAVVDDTTLEPRVRITAAHPIAAIALRPDLRELVTLDIAGEVHVWDPLRGVHLRGAPLLAPGRDCRLMATRHPLPILALCTDRTAHAIDPAAATIRQLAPRVHAAVDTRVGDRDVIVLGGEDGRLLLWDPILDRHDELHRYPEWVEWLSVVPGSARILAASARTLDAWDLADRTRLRFPDHALQIEGVHVSSPGRRVVTSSRDNLLRVFDLDTAATEHVLAPGHILGEGVHLSPDGDTLVADLPNGTLMLWDLAQSHPGEARRLTGATRSILTLRFDHDALVATCSDGRVIRWTDDLPRDEAGVRQWVRDHHAAHAADALIVPGCAPAP